MKKTVVVDRVLSGYGMQDSKVEYLGGAGGFSGAQIWKIQSGNEYFALRQWPAPHPNRERLEWLHLVLRHTQANGLKFVAAPIRMPESNGGASFVFVEGHFWELARWMPGRADFQSDPNDERLAAAMTGLARFHKSTAQVNLGFDKPSSIAMRIRHLNQLNSTLETFRSHQDFSFGNSIFKLHQIVSLPKFEATANRVNRSLASFAEQTLPVQPVIRDIWHDHLFFVGNELSGLVDFGAMQIDSIACDISRLLGSLIGADSARWEFAIDVYSKERPLMPIERSLFPLLDQSGVILGAINWLKWILIERRTFESKGDVERRIQSLIIRISDCIV